MDKRKTLKELLKHRYAHRGFHNKPKVPENSMTAFCHAAAHGFGIELDVHLTKDGRLAVIPRLESQENVRRRYGYRRYGSGRSKDVFSRREYGTHAGIRGGAFGGRRQSPADNRAEDQRKESSRLCLRVMEALDVYEGMYCIESFDPQAVRWFRKNRPDIVRGQLAGSLKKDGSVNGIQEFLLRNLWVNLLSRPDFVAYRFEDREEEAFVKYRGAKFLWTIRNYKDMKKTEAIGAAAIFEKFDPKDYE